MNSDVYCAFAQLAGGPNLAAVVFSNGFGDGEPQSAALGGSVAGAGGLDGHRPVRFRKPHRS
jgi:hypothetical protein